jgi:hypothetical protein
MFVFAACDWPTSLTISSYGFDVVGLPHPDSQRPSPKNPGAGPLLRPVSQPALTLWLGMESRALRRSWRGGGRIRVEVEDTGSPSRRHALLQQWSHRTNHAFSATCCPQLRSIITPCWSTVIGTRTPLVWMSALGAAYSC